MRALHSPEDCLPAVRWRFKVRKLQGEAPGLFAGSCEGGIRGEGRRFARASYESGGREPPKKTTETAEGTGDESRPGWYQSMFVSPLSPMCLRLTRISDPGKNEVLKRIVAATAVGERFRTREGLRRSIETLGWRLEAYDNEIQSVLRE